MSYEWLTKREDMAVVQRIMDKHLDYGDSLSVVEVNVDGDKPWLLRNPDWVVEVAEYFDEQYGFDEGYKITSKAITQVLLEDHIIH